MWRRARWRGVAGALILLLLAGSIYVSARPSGQILWLENAVAEVLAPAQALVAFGIRQGLAVGAWLRDTLHARRENVELRAQLEQLLAERDQLLELARENQQLRQLLRLTRSTRHSLLSAQVVARSPTNWDEFIVIDRGRADGVRPYMPVLTPQGVVGYVRSVTERTARVILITDPRSAVGGLDRRNSAPVLVEGTQEPGSLLTARPLAQDVAFRPGDVIVTSGYSRIFPKGLPIGRVERVQPGRYGLSQMAIVRPFVDFARLEYVLVMLRAEPGEEWPEPAEPVPERPPRRPGP